MSQSAKSATSLIRDSIQIGVSIAVPLVLLLAAGRWLDIRFGSTPLFLLSGLLVSLVITTIILVRLVRTAARLESKNHE